MICLDIQEHTFIFPLLFIYLYFSLFYCKEGGTYTGGRNDSNRAAVTNTTTKQGNIAADVEQQPQRAPKRKSLQKLEEIKLDSMKYKLHFFHLFLCFGLEDGVEWLPGGQWGAKVRETTMDFFM